MWSNKQDCCDAKGNVKSFINTSQQVPWETRMKHAPCRPDAEKSRQQEIAMAEKYKDILTLNKSAHIETFHP